MNIIVANDKSVRLTQYDAADSTPIDIQNMWVYIPSVNFNLIPIYLEGIYKELIDPDSLDIKIHHFRAPLVLSSDRTSPNYYDYSCITSPRIIAYPYSLSIIWSDGTKSNVVDNIYIANSRVNDNSMAIFINDNRIIATANQNILVKDDSLSQIMRFSIDEYYDGMSFLDSTKEIYVDYIPVDFDAAVEGKDFLSDKVFKREPDPCNPGRVLLYWLVPSRVTQEAGEVIYALSIINQEQNYVWQTLTSKLSVLPNIGNRPDNPVIPDDPEDDPIIPTPDDLDLAQRVSELENFVANIDYVSGINAETGTLTQVTREDGVQTKTTHEIDDLYTNSTANNTTIITGGGAAI